MDKKKQTRAEYQRSLQKETEQIDAEQTVDEELSRSQRKQHETKDQRFNPDEQSEAKSRALAKKLNIAIAGLGIGIILVFLILFFVG
ncbi:hypothetical protein [Pediococcus pentosaceus]|uniref:hypothetical protein n=1 Tax=Pediococcus pentosaceus TaxID=1255 RepID=UPI0018A13D2D|nr:hypothetical protein [Pediococcus pentosaceus]MBF7103315.1 hypothetical protein [Pediococcus pentosaceus]